MFDDIFIASWECVFLMKQRGTLFIIAVSLFIKLQLIPNVLNNFLLDESKRNVSEGIFIMMGSSKMTERNSSLPFGLWPRNQLH